ncbi:MAG TPA: homocysteine S-methyltransferase family protein, partial [Solirubrobacteraceae bacterium]
MILDGGVGTELAHSANAKDALDEPLWGTRALIESPDAVLRVHREYVQAGCDVISTNTWGLASALATDGPRLW